MKDFFFHLVGLILSQPRALQFLKWFCRKRPYDWVGDYMERWWVIPGWIRLHHILRADAGDAVHDHPWNYRTIILAGGYIVEDIYGRLHTCGVADTHAERAWNFHRIHAVSEGGVWTLFIAGKKRNEWGFLVNDGLGHPRKVDRHQYHGER